MLLIAFLDIPKHPPGSRPELDALIADLVNVEDHRAILGRDLAFMFTRPEELLSLGPPPSDDRIARIVRLTAAAIPALCAHLGDPRPTRTIVRARDWFALSAYCTYDRNLWPDRRYRDDDPQLLHPVAAQDTRLTVGDLCYLALGEIVNRRFDPSRTVGRLQICCPSRFPILATLASMEWRTCDAAKLGKSLAFDALHPDHLGRDTGALRRLRVYAPRLLGPIVSQKLGFVDLDTFAGVPMLDFSGSPTETSGAVYDWLPALDGFPSLAIDKACVAKLNQFRNEIPDLQQDADCLAIVHRLMRSNSPEVRRELRTSGKATDT